MNEWQLFQAFFRVGLFGFGGGPSMIPLMQAECVGAGWVTDEQFLEGLAVGNSLPGPITTKMAMYIGYNEAGWGGAFFATVGLLIPSTVLMALLVTFLLRYREHPYVAGALRAVKPVVVGMLAWVAWDLAPSGVRDLTTALLAVIAFVALVGKMHPALVIASAAAFGALALRSG